MQKDMQDLVTLHNDDDLSFCAHWIQHDTSVPRALSCVAGCCDPALLTGAFLTYDSYPVIPLPLLCRVSSAATRPSTAFQNPSPFSPRWARSQMEWWTARSAVFCFYFSIVYVSTEQSCVIRMWKCWSTWTDWLFFFPPICFSDGTFYYQPCWQDWIYPFVGPIFWSKSYARVRTCCFLCGRRKLHIQLLYTVPGPSLTSIIWYEWYCYTYVWYQ